MPHVKTSRDFKMHASSNQQYFRHQSSKITKSSLYFRHNHNRHMTKNVKILLPSKVEEKHATMQGI